jgi:hypothetical protein
VKELALHLLDVLENAAKAGAGRVELLFTCRGTWLEVCITDDGPGLAPELQGDPTDPFRTTRRDRKVGLGLPLFRAAAEATGGHLALGPGPNGRGLRVAAAFNLAHIDARPLGRLGDTLLATVLAWPALVLVVRLEPDGRVALDTQAIVAELDGVPLSHPQVRQFLARHLEAELAPFQQWADEAFGRAVEGRTSVCTRGAARRSAGKM